MNGFWLRRRVSAGHASAVALGLNLVAALWVVVLAAGTAHGMLFGVGLLVLVSAVLQYVAVFPGRFAAPEERTEEASPAAEVATPLPTAPGEQSELRARVQEELCFPLRTLLRDAPAAAEATGWQEEGRRLLAVAEQLGRELGDGRAERVAVTPLLERLLTATQAVMRTRDVRVRVVLGHRRDRLRLVRRRFFETLGELLLGTLARARGGSEVVVRTREIADQFCLTVSGEANGDDVPLDLEAARATLAEVHGEAWADVDSACGFGLSVPVPRSARRPAPAPEVRSRRHRPAEAAA